MPTFVIDTDGASDDLVAVALSLLTGPPIAAITIVAGAVTLDQATRNVAALVRMLGSDVPIYRGAASPYVRRLENDLARAHGPDGVAGVALPSVIAHVSDQPAASALIELVRAAPGEVTIVAIGPLTNIALALALDPSIAKLIREIVVSTGTVTSPGNVVPAADFNAWVDPEALAVVLGSGATITMVPWDLYPRDSVLSAQEVTDLRQRATPLGRLLLEANAGIEAITGQITPSPDGLLIADVIATAIAGRPDLVTRSARMHVAVETASPLTRGVTVVDVYGVTGLDPNVQVVLEIDRARFREVLIQTFVQPRMVQGSNGG